MAMKHVDEKLQAQLWVRTLGTLVIQYRDEPFSLKTSPGGKVMQLFLILAWAGEEGIGRIPLQDALYNRRNTDAANALRITSSRLRKLLNEMMPGGSSAENNYAGGGYVEIRDNTYFLGGKGRISIRMDAVVMEKCYEQAVYERDESKRRALLEQGCDLYQGDFLPSISGEAWVEQLRSHYQEIYFKSVRELCHILSGKGDYEKMLKVCTQAMNIYPMEEWAQLKMKYLVSLKRYRESMKVYDEAVKMLYAEMGMVPSHSMLDQLHEVGKIIQYQSGDLADIKKVLMEENSMTGAYCYTYPGFVDCFRMEVRVAERGKRDGALIVCTVLDGKGCRVENEDKLAQYTTILDQVIRDCMRKGDIFTQYTREQRLILANDLKADKCRLVENRLAFEFRRRCGKKAQLQVQGIPLENWLTDRAKTDQKNKNSRKPRKEFGVTRVK